MTNYKHKAFRSRKSLIFYVSLMAWPMLQFAIFYVCINFNSILLAFKKIDAQTFETLEWTFSNFTDWFTRLNDFDQLKNAFLVSLKTYGLTLVISVPLALFFSYYIFKKLRGAMLFRTMLFLPSIISSIVLVTIFKYFMDYVFLDVLNALGIVVKKSLVSSENSRYAVLMFYSIFVGFGTNVLLYSNKMSTISPEMIEAAELDGAGAFREFFSIVLPQSFSTISVFLVTGITAIFTNEINNFSFFGYNMYSNTTTIGFLMFYKTQHAKADMSQYPPIAALGLMCTAIAIPLTFLARRLLNKYGPSED